MVILSDEEKARIRAEEEYRAQIKRQLGESNKQLAKTIVKAPGHTLVIGPIGYTVLTLIALSLVGLYPVLIIVPVGLVAWRIYSARKMRRTR